MADVFSAEKRSEIMSRIRSKNTKAEIIVFRYLRMKNIYFQKHYKRGYGNPDIALPRKKKVVFIDGDFWHGRRIERLKPSKMTRSEYWLAKINRNISRDIQVNEYYGVRDWDILRVWDSDIIRMKTRSAVLEKIESFLKN